MNTIDERLTRRLEHLDRAIPEPRRRPDELRSGTILAMPTSRRRRPGRRAVLLLLAPAALLAAVTVATAQRSLAPEAPDVTLDAALTDVFANSDCITAAVARPAIQARLDRLGRGGWTIQERPGAATARCVAAVAFSEDRMILLLPAAGEAVSKAMEGVGSELLTRCLNREAAIAYVSSVLSSLGVADVAVRIDPAAHAGPTALIDEYERHVAAGCYVYSGYQHDADGKPYVVLWGHGP
jgi:hypothetical protein